MSITILNPGMLTSVQDLGRIGYQQYGVSVSGVMDPRSASIANILVGNDEGEAVLECTMMGPHLRFDAPNIIAITGGDLGATLDGQRIDTYRAIPVNAGQTLRFTMLRTGCRAFVAFAGGLDIPVVMGSRSTNMKAKIGGYQGRKLQKDDVIAFRAPKTDLKNLGVRHISPEFVPRAEYKLRVVLGPQDDAFTELGATTFLSSVYTLTPEFDRMGCRLDGELIEHIKERRHHLRRHCLRRDSGAICGQADHHAGRPPDHRRLHEDRQRYLRRLSHSRPAQAGDSALRKGLHRHCTGGSACAARYAALPAQRHESLTQP